MSRQIKFFPLDEHAVQVLEQIQKELTIYKEDGKCIKYTLEDLIYLINRIEFWMQDNRCIYCKKLITYGDFQNFECGECGHGLSESLKR